MSGVGHYLICIKITRQFALILQLGFPAEEYNGPNPIIGCSGFLFGGGGFYLGPPFHYYGGGLGTILVIVIIVLLLRG
jgi:hypothetical protein